MERYNIAGYVVDFDRENHYYYVNGKAVISVTQIIDTLLPKPYKNVDPEILKMAADKGNQLHDMIEHYERFGKKTMHVEMHSYLALKAQHQFDVLENEKIVLIHHKGLIVAAGRFDMIVQSPYLKGLGIADVKRMVHLDEERLKMQLNLYRLGYEQTYKKKINYLKCIHIRYRQYHYLDIPIDRQYAKSVLEDYIKNHPESLIDAQIYQ